MYSLEAMDRRDQQVVKLARKNKKQPLILTPEDVQAWNFSLPDLGSYVPRGWERVEDPIAWFVDHSGWGKDDEPALSLDQFKKVLLAHVQENPTHGYAIVETGPFQMYVAIFQLKDDSPAGL